MDGALAWILGLAGSLIGGLSLSGLLLSLVAARRIRRLERRLVSELRPAVLDSLDWGNLDFFSLAK